MSRDSANGQKAYPVMDPLCFWSGLGDVMARVLRARGRFAMRDQVEDADESRKVRAKRYLRVRKRLYPFHSTMDTLGVWWNTCVLSRARLAELCAVWPLQQQRNA
jgi:hypothetical protein